MADYCEMNSNNTITYYDWIISTSGGPLVYNADLDVVFWGEEAVE